MTFDFSALPLAGESRYARVQIYNSVMDAWGGRGHKIAEDVLEALVDLSRTPLRKLRKMNGAEIVDAFWDRLPAWVPPRVLDLQSQFAVESARAGEDKVRSSLLTLLRL
jgi:hypothetical protein